MQPRSGAVAEKAETGMISEKVSPLGVSTLHVIQMLSPFSGLRVGNRCCKNTNSASTRCPKRQPQREILQDDNV